jgi:hypothetical protein
MEACLIKAEAAFPLGRNPNTQELVLAKRKISCPTPLFELRTVQPAAVTTPITVRGRTHAYSFLPIHTLKFNIELYIHSNRGRSI